MYEKALERAGSYGIDGVTYQLTQGVVKNIIPAIASTNAIIAGMCTLETLKIISMCSTGLDNMLMYVGTDSIYTLASRYEKDEDCTTCAPAVPMTASASDALESVVSQVMDKLSIDKESNSFSLSLNARVLYSSKKGGVFGDTSGTSWGDERGGLRTGRVDRVGWTGSAATRPPHTNTPARSSGELSSDQNTPVWVHLTSPQPRPVDARPRGTPVGVFVTPPELIDPSFIPT